MTRTFPSHKPSDRRYVHGEWPVTRHRFMSNTEQRILHATAQTGQELRLTYANRTTENVQEYLDHFESSYGTQFAFEIPAEVFAGWTRGTKLMGSELLWQYKEAPRITSPRGMVATLQITLITATTGGQLLEEGGVRTGLPAGPQPGSILPLTDGDVTPPPNQGPGPGIDEGENTLPDLDTIFDEMAALYPGICYYLVAYTYLENLPSDPNYGACCTSSTCAMSSWGTYSEIHTHGRLTQFQRLSSIYVAYYVGNQCWKNEMGAQIGYTIQTDCSGEEVNNVWGWPAHNDYVATRGYLPSSWGCVGVRVYMKPTSESLAQYPNAPASILILEESNPVAETLGIGLPS